jgi:hypothetical protein
MPLRREAMTKRRRRAETRRGAAPDGRAQPRADALGVPPVPTTQEMMVMAGNRPHETILHDYTLEDFGLDVLRVIHPDHP